MFNISILKSTLGYYTKKPGEISVNTAITKIQKKFEEIAGALNIDPGLIFTIDVNGIPFIGHRPSILYKAKPLMLSRIKPTDIPTTFFVTGDAILTTDLTKINNKFRVFENLPMPNSHKFAQSLICKSVVENPVYISKKPIIPIGIDNYIFVSPNDVVKRFEVIEMYKEVLGGRISRKRRGKLNEVIKNNFDKEVRNKVLFNHGMVEEFRRIFPNALNVTMTNEPPSSITHIGQLLSGDNRQAVIQMEYGTHPAYFEFFSDFYYLYLSDDPLNKNSFFPKSTKKNIMVGSLPVLHNLMSIGKPKISGRKRILITTGGAAGRTFSIIYDLLKNKINTPIELFALTGEEKKSRKFFTIKQQFKKLETPSIKITAIPRIGIKDLAKIFEKSSASLGFPGTYTTLGALASGRPFGAILDSRKTKDRIFTDHVIGNAYFARDVFKYPVIIINDRLKTQDIVKLIDNEFINKAYEEATKKNGMRQMFSETKKNWRNIFIYFIK